MVGGSQVDDPPPQVEPPPQTAPPQAGPPAQGDPAPQATPAAPSGKPEAPVDAPGSKRTVYGTIRGTVAGLQGKPLQGVMVQLIARDQSGLLRVTGTDEKGQYVFQDLPAGMYDIEVASGGGLRRRQRQVKVQPPFRNIVDFKVGPDDPDRLMASVGRLFEPQGQTGDAAALPPVVVRGVLLDQRKQPVPEAMVTLVAQASAGIHQAISGPDGAFLVEAVPPGLYRLRVASPGHVVIDLASVEVPPGTGLTFNLSLVDYPLQAGDRRADVPPHEEPRPLAPAP